MGASPLRTAGIALLVGTAASLTVGLATSDPSQSASCRDGRLSSFASPETGQLTVWRPDATRAVYFVPAANAQSVDGAERTTGIRGLLLLRGGGGGRLGAGRVTAIRFDTAALLAGQLPGGLRFYRSVLRRAETGKCGGPPPAIRRFLDEAKSARTSQLYYSSARRAQRSVDWPIVWGGARLGGVPFRAIEVQPASGGVHTVMVLYVAGSKSLTLWETPSGSRWSTAMDAQLRRGFHVAPGRVLDVAHGPPTARVGSTIVVFGSERRRTRNEWIAVVKALRKASATP